MVNDLVDEGGAWMFGPHVLGRELAGMRVEALRRDASPRMTGPPGRIRRAIGRMLVRTDARPLPRTMDAPVQRIGDRG
jgi:hypothetical protein